jgi:hypothetical protein
MKKPTAKVFIDASNTFFAQKKLGWQVNCQNYASYLEGDNRHENFLIFLKKNNFRIFWKP